MLLNIYALYHLSLENASFDRELYQLGRSEYWICTKLCGSLKRKLSEFKQFSVVVIID